MRKTINLVFAGNKVFVTYQTKGLTPTPLAYALDCEPSITFYWAAQQFLLWAAWCVRAAVLWWLRGLNIGHRNNH